MKQAISHNTMKKERSCFICGRASSQKFCVAHQWHERQEDPRNVCPICNKVFTQLKNLKRHREIHTREKPGVGVTREHCYSLTESAAKPFLCDICGQTFAGKSSLFTHQKKIHDYTMIPPSTAEKIPYNCDSCGKTFTQRSVMWRHCKRMHSTERPFKCSVCEKAFAQTCDLVRHERAHRKEKRFICDVCGRRFLRRHHLQDHALTHTRARSFLCDRCGLTFLRQVNFVNHRKRCSLLTGPSPGHPTDFAAFVADFGHTASLSGQQKHDASTSQVGVMTRASYLDNILKQTGVAQPMEQTSAPGTLSEGLTQSLGLDFSLFLKVTANGKRYVCDFCNKECTYMHEFSRHRRTHTKERPFVCNTCGKRFKQTSHLITHRVIHTKERAYKCEICGRDFALRNSFVRHCKKMHGVFPQKTASTEEQGSLAPQETLDSDHLENKTGGNEETAPNEVVPSSIDLLNQPEHMYFQPQAQVDKLQTEAATALVDFLTQDTDWSAILDGTSSTAACSTTMDPSVPNEATDFSTFRRTLPDGVRYICNFCNKAFGKKFDLIRHRRIHLKQKPFACDTCGKCFTQKRHLVDHRASHSKVKSYICSNCGRAFAYGASLRYHRRKPCTRPPQTYLDSQSQPKEKVVPVNGRYFCDQCDKSFGQRYGLIRHKLSHTSKGKPFACEFCDKHFSKKDNARIHQKRHTQLGAVADPTVYICETCGKCLISKTGLILHKKTHINEDRWYTCSICGVGFVEKRCLSDHHKTHPVTKLKEKQFMCGICRKTFSLKQSLTRHLKKSKCTHSAANKLNPEIFPGKVEIQATQ